MQVHGKKAAQRLAVSSRRRTVGPFAAAVVQQRGNTFIKQVMDQVKRDMENDPKLKQDWEKAQKTAKRMAESGATFEERFNEFGERVSTVSSKTSEVFSRFKESAQAKSADVSATFTKATEQSESLKKAADTLKAGTGVVMDKTKGVFTNVMDSSSKVFNWVGDADKKGEKTKTWRDSRHAMKAHMDAQVAAAEEAAAQAEAAAAVAEGAAGGAKAATAEAKATAEPETALVVSESKGSTWDRFGAGLRDMPFLSSVFENEVFDRIFGESEVAAAIREMKEMDYTFQLEEFSEDIECIVAPHIIKTYLEGDQEALQKHCGEAAFAAVNASIKARLEQKLSLDLNILAGPRELQLVTAKLNDKGPPSFIWTFQMQQVNCLRDADGEIIEGAVDDIRNVCYAMVVNRHPNVDKELDLEYPWQISELAILWNQPCF